MQSEPVKLGPQISLTVFRDSSDGLFYPRLFETGKGPAAALITHHGVHQVLRLSGCQTGPTTQVVEVHSDILRHMYLNITNRYLRCRSIICQPLDKEQRQGPGS